jgi:aspartate-semialdehyde dehydrogenase
LSVIAIIHPTNLLGQEVKETLERQSTQWREIRLLSTDEDEVGTLTEAAGAAALVARYEPDSLRGATTIYFCGPIDVNRNLFQDVPKDATVVVLSPDAKPEDGLPVVAGVNSEAARPGRILLSPHPAVVLLAHLLHPLRGLSLESAVASVVLPASMADNPGLEELFKQTQQIVALTPRRETKVFGTQLAFNLLPSATDAQAVADSLAQVLEEDPETTAPAPIPPVALHLTQGGIFHSLAVSLYVRFREAATVQTLRKALAASPYLEAPARPKHLGPIEVAAGEKVLLGTIRKDATGGFWIWAVMDNLTRGGALNAVEIVEGVQ